MPCWAQKDCATQPCITLQAGQLVRFVNLYDMDKRTIQFKHKLIYSCGAGLCVVQSLLMAFPGNASKEFVHSDGGAYV